MHFKEAFQNRLKAYRNPVYLLYAIIGVALFLFGALVAEAGVGRLELDIFYLFNHMSDSFYNIMVLISFFGTIGAMPVVVLIALIRKHYANAFKVFLASVLAYVTAFWLKSFDIRPRPTAVIDNANLRELNADILLGYPSGHMAVAAVLALTSYIYLPKKYHKFITGMVILVGISRMYLGVHFPMDLIGGWGIGLFFGGLLNFAFGSRHYSPVLPEKVQENMLHQGMPVDTVKIAAVDARGSVPYIASGRHINLFVKVVGVENNIADWLFKMFRRIMYRRLEDEHPYLSPKRQLEHEAYVAMLAKQAGVHTPTIVGIFEADQGRWALAQEMIDGKSLDSTDRKLITNQVLDDIWKQVKTLHAGGIIHRDLRAANIFLDDKKKPWLIDFGFSEASINETKFHHDTVELVASLSLLTDYKKVIASAVRVIGKDELRSGLPYLTYSSLSGETTKQLKKRRSLLKKIRNEIMRVTGVKKVKTVRQKRFDYRTLIAIVALGIGFNALAPQIGSFNDSVNAARDAEIMYIALGAVLSAFTYVLAGFTYKFLSFYPIKTWPTVIVQVASSFASKLAPAGTGAMALNGRYLYKNNHDYVQAGAVAGANTLLGLIGHVSVVIMVSLFTKGSVLDLLPDIHVSRTIIIISVLSFITVMLTLSMFPIFRKVFIKGRDKVFEQFKYYSQNKPKLLYGYLTSVAITLTYSATLYFCALALGIDLSLLDVVYVFTAGAIAATVTPTPGGLGGAEAALVASMTSLGVDGGAALAATLLYRLLTFWLPIIPGFIAFRYVTANDYV